MIDRLFRTLRMLATIAAVATLIWAATVVCSRAEDVIGSCPKPAIVVHHKHHAKTLPLCTCIADAPHTIMLPAPEPEIDPIPLSVYPYYTVISFNDDPPAKTFEDWQPGYNGYYGWTDGIGGSTFTPHNVAAPEIDPSGMGSALTLLVGGLAVLRGRRSQSSGEAKS